MHDTSAFSETRRDQISDLESHIETIERKIDVEAKVEARLKKVLTAMLGVSKVNLESVTFYHFGGTVAGLVRYFNPADHTQHGSKQFQYEGDEFISVGKIY